MSGATQPAFLVVDDDIEIAAALEGALNRRFGADYKIIAQSMPGRALAVLQRLRGRGRQVAVVIADLRMPQMTGTDFLLRGAPDPPSRPAGRDRRCLRRQRHRADQPGAYVGAIDAPLVKPWEPADRYLYLRVSELLEESVRATEQAGLSAMSIVADPQLPRTHELRDLLDRNGVPAEFLTRKRHGAASCSPGPARTVRSCRSRCTSTGGCRQTPPTPTSPRRWECTLAPSTATTTSPWSGQAQPACPPPCLPPRMGCTRSCWNRTPAGRPAAPR